MLKPPPLKEKPRPPMAPLFVPQRKGRAALFVVVPAVLGGVTGGVIGAAVQWISGADVLWFFVGGLTFGGALVGIRTLFMVLSSLGTHLHEDASIPPSHTQSDARTV